jgi:hypothetical protein
MDSPLLLDRALVDRHLAMVTAQKMAMVTAQKISLSSATGECFNNDCECVYQTRVYTLSNAS